MSEYLANSFGLEFDIRQWSELEKFLEEIPGNVGQNAMVEAMRKGGELIQKSAQNILAMSRLEPPRSRAGRSSLAKGMAEAAGISGSLLSKNIKVHVTKKYQPYFFKVMIGIKIDKKGTRKTEPYYAHMIEFGHRIVGRDGKDTGKRYPAMGFMTQAFSLNQPIVQAQMFSSIVNELEKRWKRIPSKSRPQLDFSRLR